MIVYMYIHSLIILIKLIDPCIVNILNIEIKGKIRKIRKTKIKKSDIEDKKIKVKTTSKNKVKKS